MALLFRGSISFGVKSGPRVGISSATKDGEPRKREVALPWEFKMQIELKP